MLCSEPAAISFLGMWCAGTLRSEGGGMLLSRKVNHTKMILFAWSHIFGRAVLAAWIGSVNNPRLEKRDLDVELLVCYCWSVFLIP